MWPMLKSVPNARLLLYSFSVCCKHQPMMTSSKSKSLMNCRFHRPHATHRLFCFPWAGGGSNFYAAWGKDIAPNIEVIGVTLPGRESRFRETPSTSSQDTVAEIASTIATDLGDKPFIFFGHSMGSLLCYETAKLLKENFQRQPECMYLSGASAPHSESRRRKLIKLSTATDEEFLEHLKTLGGTPSEVLNNRELLDLFLPALKADYSLVEQMTSDRPSGTPALSCNFTFFDGINDDDHDYESWKELTQGSFLLHKMPGGHFYLKDASNQTQILTFMQNDFPAA